MGDTTLSSSFQTPKHSLLHEFLELLFGSRDAQGAAKNDWLMPFDATPSSIKRKAMSGPSR